MGNYDVVTYRWKRLQLKKTKISMEVIMAGVLRMQVVIRCTVGEPGIPRLPHGDGTERKDGRTGREPLDTDLQDPH